MAIFTNTSSLFKFVVAKTIVLSSLHVLILLINKLIDSLFSIFKIALLGSLEELHLAIIIAPTLLTKSALVILLFFFKSYFSFLPIRLNPNKELFLLLPFLYSIS